jgi:hypothetical protein
MPSTTALGAWCPIGHVNWTSACVCYIQWWLLSEMMHPMTSSPSTPSSPPSPHVAASPSGTCCTSTPSNWCSLVTRTWPLRCWVCMHELGMPQQCMLCSIGCGHRTAREIPVITKPSVGPQRLPRRLQLNNRRQHVLEGKSRELTLLFRERGVGVIQTPAAPVMFSLKSSWCPCELGPYQFDLQAPQVEGRGGPDSRRLVHGLDLVRVHSDLLFTARRRRKRQGQKWHFTTLLSSKARNEYSYWEWCPPSNLRRKQTVL